MSINNSESALVSRQDQVAEVGKSYFSSLFKEPGGFPIEEILKVVSLFPSIITNEMNIALQEEISKK